VVEEGTGQLAGFRPVVLVVERRDQAAHLAAVSASALIHSNDLVRLFRVRQEAGRFRLEGIVRLKFA
jgi:hypothetical protein